MKQKPAVLAPNTFVGIDRKIPMLKIEYIKAEKGRVVCRKPYRELRMLKRSRWNTDEHGPGAACPIFRV